MIRRALVLLALAASLSVTTVSAAPPIVAVSCRACYVAYATHGGNVYVGADADDWTAIELALSLVPNDTALTSITVTYLS